MFKKKFFIVSAIAAMLLTSLPVIAVQAQEPKSTDIVTSLPVVPPDDVLGYLTHDGGKTWTPIKEQPGVAERIPAGTSIK